MPSQVFSLVLLLALYAGSYGYFRTTHQESWERDDRIYVIYPADTLWLHYLYRPASYVDGLLSGMRSHIGPHQWEVLGNR